MKKLKFGSSLISNSKIPSTIAIKTLRTIPEPINLPKLNFFKNEISNQKIDSKNKEKEIHQSYKNEIVKKTNNSLKKNI